MSVLQNSVGTVPQEKGWPLPNWKPTPRAKVKCGSGLKKRFFDVQPDGQHGETKRGWAPGSFLTRNKPI